MLPIKPEKHPSVPDAVAMGKYKLPLTLTYTTLRMEGEYTKSYPGTWWVEQAFLGRCEWEAGFAELHRLQQATYPPGPTGRSG